MHLAECCCVIGWGTAGLPSAEIRVVQSMPKTIWFYGVWAWGSREQGSIRQAGTWNISTSHFLALNTYTRHHHIWATRIASCAQLWMKGSSFMPQRRLPSPSAFVEWLWGLSLAAPNCLRTHPTVKHCHPVPLQRLCEGSGCIFFVPSLPAGWLL